MKLWRQIKYFRFVFEKALAPFCKCQIHIILHTAYQELLLVNYVEAGLLCLACCQLMLTARSLYISPGMRKEFFQNLQYFAIQLYLFSLVHRQVRYIDQEVVYATHSVRCGSVTSFFISTQKDVRGYQKFSLVK